MANTTGDYPRMLYNHDRRETRIVQDAEAEASAGRDWQRKPFPPPEPPPSLDPLDELRAELDILKVRVTAIEDGERLRAGGKSTQFQKKN